MNPQMLLSRLVLHIHVHVPVSRTSLQGRAGFKGLSCLTRLAMPRLGD